ncbi:hypothetical protein K443DRAFT_15821 [Laccaria amethystina LaAM-08-1]|uniref:DUF7770 domain-containing protein n=1 Tax=Laccaria amethystina LaAM-08-1 TaxID=1095629 RepID=A0A0C9WQ15_9AGAR|nr:hypothetical protein K443DRAFT_15821 [Laccaria amethystina LaAM-08-1]
MSIHQAYLHEADKTRCISKIVITASGTVNTGSQSTSEQLNYFHWRIYLVLPATEGTNSENQSVLLDMIPTNPPIGTLIISSKSNAASTARNKIELAIAPSPDLTVGQVIDLFIKNRLHHYKFDESGSGCLYWTITAVDLLEKAQYCEADATQNLHGFHEMHAHAHPERHPLPLRKGQFY